MIHWVRPSPRLAAVLKTLQAQAVVFCLIFSTILSPLTPLASAQEIVSDGDAIEDRSASAPATPAVAPDLHARPSAVLTGNGGTIPRDELGLFGDLSHKVVIYVNNTRLAFGYDQLKKMIGDPFTLQPTTAAKLRLLQPRMRLELYNAILERMSDYSLAPSQGYVPGVTPESDPPVIVGLDNKGSDFLLGRMKSSLTRGFKTEDYVDLGVFLLSKMPFSPKTSEGWDKVIKSLVSMDLILAAAVILAMVGTDKVSMSAGGKIFALPGDHFRIGWYGSVSGAGMHWKDPTLRGGVKAAGAGLELESGYYYRKNPDQFAVGQQVEINFREHWLKDITEKLGATWQVEGSGGARYIVKHGNPVFNNTWSLFGELYARKDKPFGNPNIAFGTKVNGGTDFHGAHSASLAVGLESTYGDIGAYIRLSDSQDPRVKSEDHSAKFLISGSFDSTTDRNRKWMLHMADMVQQDLLDLKRVKADLAAFEPKLDDFGTGKLTHQQERELVNTLSMKQNWVHEVIMSLNRHVREYIEVRNEFYLVSMHYTPNQITDSTGPLSIDDLNAARFELGAGEDDSSDANLH